MNDHVGKPFDLDQLVQVLRHHAGRPSQEGAVQATPAEALTPAVSHAADEAGVALAAALRRFGGHRRTYLRSLHDFLRELATLPAAWQQALQGGEQAELVRRAHTLKGLAATVGATGLSQQAAHFERLLARRPGADDAARALALFTEAVHAAQEPLQALHGALHEALLQAEAAAAPAAAVAGPERQALAEELDLLLRLLGDSDMQAMEVMDRLRGRYAAALGADLAALDEAIGQLDFEAAAAQCGQLQLTLAA